MDSNFFIITREAGAENPSIPAWANRNIDPLKFADESTCATRTNLSEVPGAFLLSNVLNLEECFRLVTLSETLGYIADAAVSLPRSMRHNDSCTWICDDGTVNALWQRMATNVPFVDQKQALGLNARLRFYRFQPGDYFSPHTDGAWPGTRVNNGALIHNAFDDRYSLMTVLFYLTDDYEGGATRFYLNKNAAFKSPEQQSSYTDIRVAAGNVLCFPHGHHPLHCLHSSEEITQGTKYIIRTDLLVSLN